MDAQEDLVGEPAAAKEPQPIDQGYAGGDTRFQVIGRLYSITAGMGIDLKVDVPDDDLSVGTWSRPSSAPTGTSARPTRCSASPSWATRNLIKLYLPARLPGVPAAQGLPAAGPAA